MTTVLEKVYRLRIQGILINFEVNIFTCIYLCPEHGENIRSPFIFDAKKFLTYSLFLCASGTGLILLIDKPLVSFFHKYWASLLHGTKRSQQTIYIFNFVILQDIQIYIYTLTLSAMANLHSFELWFFVQMYWFQSTFIL